MIPVQCQVKHDPPNAYGDCVRAAFASILELPAGDVPHFFHDNCDGPEASRRMDDFLASRGLISFWQHLPPEMKLAEILHFMHETNPHVYYILWHGTADGHHVVIGRGGEIVFNPAWYSSPIVGPAGEAWSIQIIARL